MNDDPHGSLVDADNFTGGKSLEKPNFLSNFEFQLLELYSIFDVLVLSFYLVPAVKRRSFRNLGTRRF
jgi:hypothetical protein